MDGTLFDRVRRLKLPPQDYAIFGSGPLAIRGIIPACNDLDILCRREVWDFIRSIGCVEFLPEYNVTIVTLSEGAVTFGTEWGIGDFDIDELISTAEIIGELPFVQLEHVIRYKKIRCSAKDMLHLDALAESDLPGSESLIESVRK